MTRWRVADAAAVRARLAAATLGEPPAPRTLGSVALRPHQRDAASRLRRSLLRVGGALLADDVGLGKTYTALAAVSGLGRLVVVAPASLGPMWQHALQAAGAQGDFLSFEALSRTRANHARHGRITAATALSREVVIVDEAHHARNPATRRYRALAALTATARVLLLSATPVHNATDDLHALLALFLGTRVHDATPSVLAACMVRRTHADVPFVSTPARAPPIWLEAQCDPAVLAAVLAIPPACPPRDGGVANALVSLGLVRAWSSTDAALRNALQRRVARAESLRDVLTTGRHPSSVELRAWVIGDDATQLAFPELVTQNRSPVDTSELMELVTAHASGARAALEALVASQGSADDSRCDLLRRVRADHLTQPIVVFSQYAESVRAMFRRLAHDGGVCAVTAHGALVTGGRLSRGEALARFAPRALGARPPRRVDAITMLIATDLLSEGLNLQDAAVVVHLDLPWTPARLAQRMGRVWRLGSSHSDVFEYAIAPPPPAEEVAAVIARLHRKAALARASTGVELSPVLHPYTAAEANRNGDDTDDLTTGPTNVPSASERLREHLLQWVEEGPEAELEETATRPDATNEPCTIVAAVRAPVDGWLAAVTSCGHGYLVAREVGHDATTDPIRVLDIARAALGAPCAVSPTRVELAVAEVKAFLAFRRAAAIAGLTVGTSTAHARVSSRIATLVATSQPHRRPVISRLAASANRAISDIAGAGVEHALADLLTSTETETAIGELEPERWLEKVIAVGESARRSNGTAEQVEPFDVPAILILISRDRSSGPAPLRPPDLPFPR